MRMRKNHDDLESLRLTRFFLGLEIGGRAEKKKKNPIVSFWVI